MNLFEFEMKLKRDNVRWQKKNIKRSWLLGVIYPVMILWGSVSLYFNPTHWVHALGLGINITSCFFYIMLMLHLIQDYKQDCRILEWFETKYKDEYESDNRIE